MPGRCRRRGRRARPRPRPGRRGARPAAGPAARAAAAAAGPPGLGRLAAAGGRAWRHAVGAGRGPPGRGPPGRATSPGPGRPAKRPPGPAGAPGRPACWPGAGGAPAGEPANPDGREHRLTWRGRGQSHAARRRAERLLPDAPWPGPAAGSGRCPLPGCLAAAWRRLQERAAGRRPGGGRPAAGEPPAGWPPGAGATVSCCAEALPPAGLPPLCGDGSVSRRPDRGQAARAHWGWAPSATAPVAGPRRRHVSRRGGRAAAARPFEPSPGVIASVAAACSAAACCLACQPAPAWAGGPRALP